MDGDSFYYVLPSYHTLSLLMMIVTLANRFGVLWNNSSFVLFLLLQTDLFVGGKSITKAIGVITLKPFFKVALLEL